MGHWTSVKGALFVVPRPPERLLLEALEILHRQEHGGLWGMYWTRNVNVSIVPNADIKNLREGEWISAIAPVVQHLRDAGFVVQGRVTWQDEDDTGGTYEP